LVVLGSIRQPCAVGTNGNIEVGLLDQAASRDAELVGRLVDLVNEVYADAERGLWQAGTTRTSHGDAAELIAAGQLAVARRGDDRIVGSVQVHQVAEDTSELGMLVAAPDARGAGIGRALVDFAERHSAEQGLQRIQLQLLVPRTWRHPSKELLSGWYTRLGYEIVRVVDLSDDYPHLAPRLATPCDLQVREKRLA
jgi:ribosomal protein S18 acetylase RimI-like enzyme